MKTRKVKAPVKSFLSKGGRTFTITTGVYEERFKGDTFAGTAFEISYEGKPAGILWRDTMYAAPLEWHASTRHLFWTRAADAPTGIGFDVAAFATIDEVLTAWARSADEILDWSEGKVVHTIYSKTGTFQKAAS